MIRKGQDIMAKQMYDDKKGKCIAVEIEFEDEKFIVVNVHAPNEEKEKKMNFNVLRDVTEQWKKVVVAGHFNTVFNKLDMANGMVFKADGGRKELKLLMEKKNNVIDFIRKRL